MAIELVAKIVPKNDGFTGMVDAAQVISGTLGTGSYVFDNTVSGITTLTTNIINIEDGNSIIAEDVSSNLTFTDAVTGTKTLAELAAGGGGGSPGGSNTQIQYNDGGSLGVSQH